VPPQAPNHDGRAAFLAAVMVRCHRWSVEGAAGLGGHRRKYRPDHIQALLLRKQRLFAGVDPDGDDQPVAQADGVPDHIQMAIGNGIE